MRCPPCLRAHELTSSACVCSVSRVCILCVQSQRYEKKMRGGASAVSSREHAHTFAVGGRVCMRCRGDRTVAETRTRHTHSHTHGRERGAERPGPVRQCVRARARNTRLCCSVWWRFVCAKHSVHGTHYFLNDFTVEAARRRPKYRESAQYEYYHGEAQAQGSPSEQPGSCVLIISRPWHGCHRARAFGRGHFILHGQTDNDAAKIAKEVGNR